MSKLSDVYLLAPLLPPDYVLEHNKRSLRKYYYAVIYSVLLYYLCRTAQECSAQSPLIIIIIKEQSLSTNTNHVLPAALPPYAKSTIAAASTPPPRHLLPLKDPTPHQLLRLTFHPPRSCRIREGGNCCPNSPRPLVYS